jgi:hypothetical protein
MPIHSTEAEQRKAIEHGRRLDAEEATAEPMLFCGKYQITQGPDGMLLACDPADDGLTFALTERNLDAMVFAAGMFQLSPLPGQAVGISHIGEQTGR